jgi:hypothetical protein
MSFSSSPATGSLSATSTIAKVIPSLQGHVTPEPTDRFRISQHTEASIFRHDPPGARRQRPASKALARFSFLDISDVRLATPRNTAGAGQ